MKLRSILICLLIISGLFLGSKVFAIEDSSSILMNLIPANPAPGEMVDITLSSFAENLDNATISWFVDGKGISVGIGKKNISVETPALGKELLVVAKISTPTKESQVTRIIRPAETVLLWQAIDSYVPPFYKGKALPAPDTFVKVVAMPEIRNGNNIIDSKNLVYSWQENYDNVQGASGYGKNSMLFKNNYLGDSDTIGVTVSTTDQKSSSGANINIGMFAPKISFYRQDENLGILWDNALAEINQIIGNTETIVAIPYFISPKDIRQPDLVFNWSINNSAINIDSSAKNIIPLAAEEGSSGSATVRLEIENINKIFETAKKEIRIEF